MPRASAIPNVSPPAARAPLPRLVWFVALSALCHLPLFWLWQAPSVSTGLPSARDLELVPLEPARAEAAPGPHAAARRSSAPAVPHQPPHEDAPVPRDPPPAATADHGPPSTETTLTAPPVLAQAPLDGPATAIETEQAMRAHLHEALARHFFYPNLARRRGWQGVVTLAFQVTPQGAIEDIRVAASSGHGVLDRAATDALGRVGAIDGGAAGNTRREPLRMRLPVVYALTES